VLILGILLRTSGYFKNQPLFGVALLILLGVTLLIWGDVINLSITATQYKFFSFCFSGLLRNIDTTERAGLPDGIFSKQKS
jgi:hypothetical protein